MKVFVRTSDLGGKTPRVVAYYDDNSMVKDDAHGPGLTVLSLPMSALRENRDDSVPMPVLLDDWRARAGSVAVTGEAQRRIDEAFSILDQLGSLRETIDLVIQHGGDSSKWPTEAKQRKAEIDAKWNYVDEIRERARAHATAVPLDPGSDKGWPTRLAKRKQS